MYESPDYGKIIITLTFIAAIFFGPMIFGMHFWFWFFLLGILFMMGWGVFWIYLLLSGATRWARRQ
jgi:hypothetical protein